jgi:hypothetical protein
VFGWLPRRGLANLVRPSLVLVAVGLAATAFGLVLHNAGLAGLPPPFDPQLGATRSHQNERDCQHAGREP